MVNASRHNDGSSISANLHRANNQGIDERNDRGNDVANEDGNDNHGNDNTEDVGDTNRGDDANTTILGTSIDLVKKNRPLLDRLGKFGKVLENLLEIGTAVSEVNSQSLSAKNVSNISLDEINPIAKAVLASVGVIYKVRSPKFTVARVAEITADS